MTGISAREIESVRYRGARELNIVGEAVCRGEQHSHHEAPGTLNLTVVELGAPGSSEDVVSFLEDEGHFSIIEVVGRDIWE